MVFMSNVIITYTTDDVIVENNISTEMFVWKEKKNTSGFQLRIICDTKNLIYVLKIIAIFLKVKFIQVNSLC